MLNISIMASLRNLPLVAEFGYGALFYFFMAGIFFLIPCALVSAELATGWPKSGGVYIWVREAFGDNWGFFAIWMQWVHNVTWYPAILSFVATTLAFIIDVNLMNNPFYILSVILISFWGMTWLNYKGIKISALFSTFGVISGTIIPGLFIILLGVVWVTSGNPTQIHFNWESLIPHVNGIKDLVFLSGMFLAFAGLEVSAGYAGEVKNPQKNFPLSIILAGLAVFFLFMLGSLSIGVIIPKEKLSLVAGLMEAFRAFLDYYHLAWLIKLLGALLVIGAIAEVNSWIIGPVKALYTTTEHGNLPPIFQKQNKHGMPTNLLLFQAIVVTIVSCIFPFMPSISSSYWLLTAVSIQIYLVMYILMFAAAIRLRYTRPHVPRAYKIPHPHKGMWVVAFVGMISSTFAFLISFIPPAQLKITNFWLYEFFIIIVFVAMSLIPLIIHRYKRPNWDPTHEAHYLKK
ncbi:MAG: amino acid permease [Chlamydiales bacterium]|nr:amino acid permease [Chlamydiales bacterium]